MPQFRLLALPALAALTLGACTTPTGQPLSRTEQGVLAGAAAGAVYGLQRDSDPRAKGKDILQGAVVGGIAGGVRNSSGRFCITTGRNVLLWCCTFGGCHSVLSRGA